MNKLEARLAQFSAYRGMQMGLYRRIQQFEQWRGNIVQIRHYEWHCSVTSSLGIPFHPPEDLLATTPAARHMTTDVFPHPVENNGIVKWDWRGEFEHLPNAT